MKILIISDPNSIWILNFITYVLAKDKRNEVELLCTTDGPFKWINQYENMNVKIIEYPERLKKFKEKKQKTIIEKVKLIYLCGRFIDRLGNYDVLNMQYVDPVTLLFLWKMKGTSKKLILSYWGSDLMRMSAKGEMLEKIFLRHKKFAYATFDNGDLEDLFFQKFHYKKETGKVVMLNLPILDWIDKTNLEDCKMISVQNISESKIVVAIGYNGRAEQQHLSIIKQLSRLEESYKKELLLILQMTYGGTADYIENCKKLCRDSGLEAVFFTNFQMYKENAQIRKRTDIFINAQTTDAFSGSFCEYIYADTIVLNAKWLHYRELDEYPFVYEEFDEFSSIPLLMKKVIEDISKNGHKKKIGRNKEIIWHLRSNENCKRQWENIFKFVVNKNGGNINGR